MHKFSLSQIFYARYTPVVKKLPIKFFKDKTLKVAPKLLGKFLVRKIGAEIIREKITEVEAYIGPHDLASHSSKGRTLRTEVMHGKAGTIYVYFIYGMYWMLNIVTEEKDFGSAILIRSTQSYKGPGRLTRALKIDKSLNGKMLGEESGLWIEGSEEIKNKNILRTPRIGVTYAGETWANKPYRFLIKD
jgi:DNA-3-methyladenine glycosylase